MTTAPSLLDDLEAARRELSASLEGVTDRQLNARPSGAPASGEAPRSIRDLLWHVGEYEDYVRRWIDATRRGTSIGGFIPRLIPKHLTTPALLHAWLEQTRRPTIVTIGKLAATDFDAPRTDPAGRETSFALALAALAAHDRGHAAQVQALRAAGGGDGSVAAPVN